MMDYSLDDLKDENLINIQNDKQKPPINLLQSSMNLDPFLNHHNEQDELLTIIQQKNQTSQEQSTEKLEQNLLLKSSSLELKKEKSRGRSKFTDEEDFQIFRLVQQYGKDWRELSQHFKGKSPNQIQNRYFKSIKKQYEKFLHRYNLQSHSTQLDESHQKNLSENNNLHDIKSFHDDSNLLLHNLQHIDYDHDHMVDEFKNLSQDHQGFLLGPQRETLGGNLGYDQKAKKVNTVTAQSDMEEKIQKIQFLKTQVFTLEQMMLRCKEQIWREIKQDDNKEKLHQSSSF